MIEYFKSDAGRVVQISAFETGCWINLVRPSSEEIRCILDDHGVEEDFLRAALDPEESSRVEVEEEQTLLIVDIPTIEESNVAGRVQDFWNLAYGHCGIAKHCDYGLSARYGSSAWNRTKQGARYSYRAAYKTGAPDSVACSRIISAQFAYD